MAMNDIEIFILKINFSDFEKSFFLFACFPSTTYTYSTSTPTIHIDTFCA